MAAASRDDETSAATSGDEQASASLSPSGRRNWVKVDDLTQPDAWVGVSPTHGITTGFTLSAAAGREAPFQEIL